MFDKLTIRTKLIAIVAAPLVVLVLLAAFGSIQRRADASRTRADAVRIDVVGAAAAAGQRLQQETLLTAADMAAPGSVPAADLKASRAQTDAAVAAFRSSLGKLKDNDTVDVGVVQAAETQLSFMSDLRSQADAHTGGWQELTDQYFDVEDAVVRVGTTAFGADISNPTLAAGIQNLAALTNYKSAVAHEGTLLTGAMSTGTWTSTVKSGAGDNAWADFQTAADNAGVRLAVFTSGATGGTKSAARNSLSGSAFDLVNDTAAQVASGAATDKVGGNAVAFRQAVSSMLGTIRNLEATTVTGLLSAANSHASSASTGSTLFLGGAMLAVLLCMLLAFFVSSSITGPLSQLTQAVDQVAREQLPRLVESLRNPVEEDVSFLAASQPKISVGGGAELAHLADAVGSIQQVAVEVATEQASLLRKGIGDMFVNLARRNQTLLDRQIEYIDEMEAEEQDPDHLEGLYKLDHMATRMRRNAESLLVLAGAEPTRRRGRPVPLADVVRAASLGEVEDYGRIDLLGLDEVLVKSTAALDVAHLLSELMENATHFSPPDTRVEVVGHRTKADGYVVSITDHGIGMTTEQVGEANHQLAHPPLVGLAMSRSLGFIVIGRLASRFDIGVRLMPSPTGGITAVVSLPAAIVTDAPPVADDRYEPGVGDYEPSLASVTPIGGANSATVAGATSSTLVPPIEFTTFGPSDLGPESLDEALPDSASFDERIAAMVKGEAPADPDDDGSSFTDYGEAPEPYGRDTPTTKGRGAIDPSVVAFGTPSVVPAAPSPMPAVPADRPAPPTPAVAERIETVAASSPLPPASPLPPEPSAAALAPAARVEPAPPAPVASPPATVSSGLFGGSTRPSALPLPEPLPGSDPATPAPSSARPEPLPVAASNGGLPTPVGEQAPSSGGNPFTRDAAPASPSGAPGLFGHGPTTSPAPPVPPTPSTPQTLPPRVQAPASPPAYIGVQEPAPAPTPAAPSLFGTSPSGAGPRLFGAAPTAPPAAPAAGGATGDDVTSSGLVRRRPRSEDGTPTRKLPGSDGGSRNVTTTQRSPDEVRNMLSSFRSGQRQAADEVAGPAPSSPAPAEPSVP